MLISNTNICNSYENLVEIALLDPRVVDAVMFGGDDMSADLGADVQAEVTAYARNVLLTHAAAVAIPVIDSPFFDISDDVGLEHATRRAVAEGFAGKAAIHPRQISVINAAFRPDEREIDWARKVVEANRAGVGTVAGDAVVLAAQGRIRSTPRPDGHGPEPSTQITVHPAVEQFLLTKRPASVLFGLVCTR
jgi:citrate lyase beta subunit